MKNFKIGLIVRIILLSLTIFLLFLVYDNTEFTASVVILAILIIYQVYSLTKYIDLTNRELTKFFLSIKYSDFSHNFKRTKYGKSFNELMTSFDEVIQKFQAARSEKEESHRYLQTVVQHVGIGLISYDQNGKVEFINNAAKRLLNITHLNTIDGLNKVSANLYKKIRELKTGQKEIIKFVMENDLVQLLIYAAEFKLRDKLYKLVALQNIQSELEENEMESWQKLIRVLTHEIMNSVTPISSLAGTVNHILSKSEKKDVELDPDSIQDVKSAVNTIQKRSEGLIHFVENYRNLTRIPKPDFQIIKVQTIFERVGSLMQKNIEANKIQMLSFVNPETLEVTADSEMIEQVLINLILNSIHALKNVQHPRIKLSSSLDEFGKVLIRVSDNGPGINDETIDKIFIPFFSTKKDGSGIGLSLSRQILRAHGGTIRVASIPNQETTFTLKF